MMKNMLSVILAAVMLFSFAACASNGVPPAPGNAAPAAEATPSDTAVPANGSASDTDTEVDEMKIQITVGDRTVTATLSGNASAKAFYELLEKGPVTIEMHDYGNFEKVGPLGTSIVKSDENISTTPGDIILYQGSQVTIYYDVNTWNFTLLGHVDGATGESMREFLGNGDPTVTFTAAG